MNKTITVNISGLVFHIEEEAYKVLMEYLDAVRKSLGSTETAKEILEDVEARIAELFQKHTTESNQVIMQSHVDEIIQQLGEPKDYHVDEDEDEDDEEYISDKQAKRNRRMNKRIFRHPDQKVIGGVCGGLASYFDTDPLWIRLIWAFAIIFAGFGLIIYIILWAIIPEAKTTAEKLQMTGDSVTLDAIKKRVREEKDNIHKSYTEWKNNPKKDPNFSKGFDHLASFIGQIFRFAFKFLGKATGLIFMIAGLFLLLSMVIGLTTSSIMLPWFDNNESMLSVYEWATLFFQSESDIWLLGCFGVLFILSTAGILGYGGYRILSDRTKSKHIKGLGLTLGVTWVICLFSSIVLIVQNVAEQNEDARVEYNSVVNIESDTLYLDINHDIYFSDYITGHHNKYLELIDVKDDYIVNGRVIVDVKPTHADQFAIELTKRAEGYTEKSAIERAENINYQWQLNDNLLTLDPYFTFRKEDKLRDQKIRVVIRVPEGKTVFFNKKMDRVIYNVKNRQDYYDGNMVGHFWKTENNELTISKSTSYENEME